MELMSEDFSDYMRYGSAVTKVGELTSQDLIELQNEGFVSIYSAPWRWMPVIRKHGVLGFLLQFVRVGRIWRGQLRRKAMAFREHPRVAA